MNIECIHRRFLYQKCSRVGTAIQELEKDLSVLVCKLREKSRAAAIISGWVYEFFSLPEAPDIDLFCLRLTGYN